MKITVKEFADETVLQMKERLQESDFLDELCENFYLVFHDVIYIMEIKTERVNPQVTIRNNIWDDFEFSKEIETTLNKIRLEEMKRFQFKIYYECEPIHKHQPDIKAILKIKLTKMFKKETKFIIDVSPPLPFDQKIINIIYDAGEKGISKTDLIIATKHLLSKEERDNVLKDLINQKIIKLEYDTTNGRKKQVYKY